MKRETSNYERVMFYYSNLGRCFLVSEYILQAL